MSNKHQHHRYHGWHYDQHRISMCWREMGKSLRVLSVPSFSLLASDILTSVNNRSRRIANCVNNYLLNWILFQCISLPWFINCRFCTCIQIPKSLFKQACKWESCIKTLSRICIDGWFIQIAIYQGLSVQTKLREALCAIRVQNAHWHSWSIYVQRDKFQPEG